MSNIDLTLYFVVFARISGIIMFVPILGEAQLPTYIKIYFAFFISILIYSSINIDSSIIHNREVLFYISELTVGIIIGILARVIMIALNIAGVIITPQAGLGIGTLFDPAQNEQNTYIATFLNMAALILILAFDLHLDIIISLKQTYQIIPIGSWDFIITTSIQQMLSRLSAAAKIALLIAVPFITIGMIVYLALGIVSRIMPSLQAFTLIIPPQILLSFLLISMFITRILSWFIEFYRDYTSIM